MVATLNQGTGSPEGVVTADQGSVYSDTSNGFFYMKQSAIGNTGWQRVNKLIDVKAFGAKGDGSTNDTTAIQNAMKVAVEDLGDVSNQLSSWVITGATSLNTNQLTLYWNLSNSGTTRTVSVYKNSAKSSGDKVAEGNRTGDGLITLNEQNSSGLTGSVMVTYSADDTDSGNKLMLGGTLYFPVGTYIVDSLTIDSNVALLFDDGAKLSINSSNTITINGEIKAELLQAIFSGAGAVSFGNKREISADWFNTNNDGVTDDSTAINNAINSLPKGGVVLLPSLKYLILTNPVTINSYVVLQGMMEQIVDSPYRSTTIDIKYGHNSASSIAILLIADSALRNVCINYPDQVAKTVSTPEVYGWAVGTDIAYINQDIRIENVMLYNPYQGINLVRFRGTLNNIHGQPLLTGIYASNLTDACRINNIHFWTYYTDGSGNLYNYVYNNATALDIRFTANTEFSNIFVFGYKYGAYFDKTIDGAAWAHFTNISFDQCKTPVHLETFNKLDFTNGKFTGFNADIPTMTTGTAVGGVATFSNIEFDSVNSVNVEIASNTGSFLFNNCDFQALHTPVICSGDADVKINNSLGFSNKLPLGNQHVVLDGIPNPKRDTDKALSNFNMATWSGSPAIPDNWTMSAGTGDNITELNSPDGIQLHLTPGGDGALATYRIDYTLPAEMIEENGLYVFQFDYEAKNTNNNTFRFFVTIEDSAGSNYYWGYFPNTETSALLPGEKVTMNLPIMFATTNNTLKLRIYWRAYGTVGGTIDLTNLSLYKQNTVNTTNAQIEHLARHILLDPENKGITRNIIGTDLITAQKGQLISQIYSIVNGENIKGLWLFDQTGATTTINDRGTLMHNATLSANASTLSPEVTGLARNINLSSSSYFEISDNADFTFIEPESFSVVALVNPNSMTGVHTVIAKASSVTGSTQLEWVLRTSSGKLQVYCYDDSANSNIGRIYNTSILSDVGSFHTYGFTKNTGATSANIKIYRDGVNVDDTNSNYGSYTAMENKSANVGNFVLDTSGNRSSIGSYKYSVLLICSGVLTATQMKQLDILLRTYAGKTLN